MSNSLWHLSQHGLFDLLSKFACLGKAMYYFGGAVCIRCGDLLEVSVLYHGSQSPYFHCSKFIAKTVQYNRSLLASHNGLDSLA